jgi:hypothetical protein
MKSGTVTNWFRLTFSGGIRWYKVEISNWDISDDTASVKVIKRVFDNVSKLTPKGEQWIDKDEIWTIETMKKKRKQLFDFMFASLGRKRW